MGQVSPLKSNSLEYRNPDWTNVKLWERQFSDTTVNWTVPTISFGTLGFTRSQSPRIMELVKTVLTLLLCLLASSALGATPKSPFPVSSPLTFDLPIEYNREVRNWIKHFQGPGRSVFKNWLRRSGRFLPSIHRTLLREGLPLDLAYIVMIESGFVYNATSPAAAVGPWQFIADTGSRFGLEINWWLDERRDLEKSTRAAAKYLKHLHKLFGSWYLAAAGYNTGENRIARLIQRHGTKNFWKISKEGGLHDETKDYIPKLIASMLIAKAPNLYGFREVNLLKPIETESFRVPGGTHLHMIADHLNVSRDLLRDLNSELVKGFVPSTVSGHFIKIPKGTSRKVSALLREHYSSAN